jgi:hypothetical protein
LGDFLVGSLPRRDRPEGALHGTTVLKLEDSKIVEEIGLDDAVTALQ